PIFGRLVANLADSLRDDGFSQAYVLTSQGIDQGLCTQRNAPPHARRTALASLHPSNADRDKGAPLPIAHIGQPGHPLPPNTSTLIIDAIARGTVDLAPDAAVTLPAYPYGVSTHRPSCAGTLNCGGRAFEDFWLAVLDVLVTRGFDRFYLMSGHGGNCSF